MGEEGERDVTRGCRGWVSCSRKSYGLGSVDLCPKDTKYCSVVQHGARCFTNIVIFSSIYKAGSVAISIL